MADAVGLRPDAHVPEQAPADPNHPDRLGPHVGVAGADAGLFAVDALEIHVGYAAELVGGIAAPVLETLLYVHEIDHAYEEREARGAGYQNEMLRGALAVFEGRVDRPEVRAEMDRNIHYAAGVERAQRLAETHRDVFARVSREVLASVRGGMLAVARSEHATEEGRDRCEHDPAFRHGVEAMIRLRNTDPDAFAAKARELESMAREVETFRVCMVPA
jgi:hypothetical protein